MQKISGLFQSLSARRKTWRLREYQLFVDSNIFIPGPVNYKGGGIERTQQAGKRISVAREHSNLPDYMIDMLYDEVIRLTYYFDYKSCNSHRLDAILSYYKVGYERV